MTEMPNLVDRLQDGYRDKTFVQDLKQEGVCNVFSEESKRKREERGNIEQYELSETVEMPTLYGIRTEYWETFFYWSICASFDTLCKNAQFFWTLM